jgi:hypothetical protein
VATMVYSKGLEDVGWDEMIVTMDPAVLVLDPQAAYYGAGFLEGYVTCERIRKHFFNMNATANAENTPWDEQQLNWMRNLTHPTTNATVEDRFTAQAVLVMRQFDGLVAGYNVRAGAGHTISDIEMYRFNMAVDMFPNASLPPGANRTLRPFPNVQRPRCTAFVKVTSDDIFFSHSLWLEYKFMTRMYKTFHVGDFTMSFAGFPGVLPSSNDFYVSSRGIGVMETALSDYNETNKKLYRTPLAVPPIFRTLIATTLSDSGREWADYMRVMNAGTDSGTWFVVDLKRFDPKRVAFDPNATRMLLPGLAWVVEQVPGNITARDMTLQLNRDGYLASYNVPFFPSTFAVSNYTAMVDIYGDWFSLDKTNVALQFRQREASVVDLATMKDIMRYNQYKTDPTSLILNCSQCTPNRSALLAIGARGDVNPSNGRYGKLAHVLGDCPYGAIDAKVASYRSLRSNLASKELRAFIISGPVYNDQMAPFSWYESGEGKFVEHRGMPDTYDFPWINVSSLRTAALPPAPPSLGVSPACGTTCIVLITIACIFFVSGCGIGGVVAYRVWSARQLAQFASGSKAPMTYGTADLPAELSQELSATRSGDRQAKETYA